MVLIVAIKQGNIVEKKGIVRFSLIGMQNERGEGSHGSGFLNAIFTLATLWRSMLNEFIMRQAKHICLIKIV